MINVMIADDDTKLSLSCYSFLNKHKDIKVVHCTTDGRSTLYYYKKIQPDVLILDLNLPIINGIDIINKLCKEKRERNKCNIIVISGNKNLRFQLLNTSKIYRIIPKPFEFKDLLKVIKEVPKYNKLSQKKLRELLLDLKFNMRSIGTKYLIDMINIVYNNSDILYNLKDIYCELGKKYNIPPERIQWSVRSSIETMNRSVDVNYIRNIFPFYQKSEKITTNFFINLIIEYFSN